MLTSKNIGKALKSHDELIAVIYTDRNVNLFCTYHSSNDKCFCTFQSVNFKLFI